MTPRHLLSVADLGLDGIDEVLRLADTFVEVGRRPIPKAVSYTHLDVYKRQDMTRTIRTGRARDLGPELARVASVVLAAQDAGLCAVRDGVAAAEVDRACREVVDAAGFAELFMHGTGHGVGLDLSLIHI